MTEDRREQSTRLFEAALEKDPSERAGFLDGVGATDPELRNEVESLLEAHKDRSRLESAPPRARPTSAEPGADPRGDSVSKEHHARVKELFLSACRRPQDARSEYLEQACGDDERLRQEVESLLLHHEATNLREPSSRRLPEALLDFDGGALQPALEATPERIGNYRVLQTLGEGGMGVVYEAEQMTPVTRRVALKLIKWGMDTKAVIGRFESERQALALMNHPNIASVHDAGATKEGRPFFAMELVHGEPITTYCDKQRLTVKQRLDLFLQVCEGVQHAHQKGIIHRDIKPSNILVTILDDKPTPKIIDFGVAKATSQRLTEKTVYTELGQWVGTPEYMSPEQAEMTGLDIDTRTDVYALGVVLYELLSGGHPFDATELRRAGFDGIRRILREEEPPKPSTEVHSLGKSSTDSATSRGVELPALERELRGDLDWITMKALEKDRTRRYGSPSDLAEDIRRHLRHEAVVASPPGQTYRVRKFIRRHRFGAAAGVALFVSLTAIALLMAVQSARIARERDRAEQEAAKAKAVTAFLQQTLASADPELGGNRRVTIAEVLDGAVREIGRSFQNQPDVRAAIENTIGVTYTSLGEYAEAEKHLTSALELRREIFGNQHLDVAESLLSLGILRNAQSDYDSAKKLLLEALSIRRTIVGDEHLDVAEVLQALGALGEPSDLDESESYYREALAIRTGRADPKDVADSIYGLASTAYLRGDYEEAERLHLEALDIRRQRLGEHHIDVADSLNDLALVYRNRQDYDRAVEYMRESVEATRIALGNEHPYFTMSLFNLASVLNAKGAYDQAEAPAREALATIEKTLGPRHLNTGIAYAVLASSLRGQGRYAESERLYVHGLAIFRERGAQPHRVAIRQGEYADVHMNLGKYEAAETQLLSALEVLREHYPEGNLRTRNVVSSLVALYETWGKPEKAAEYRAMLDANESK